MTLRRFPPPWSVDEANSKLDRRSFIVRDANGQALAANIAKLPELLGGRS